MRFTPHQSESPSIGLAGRGGVLRRVSEVPRGDHEPNSPSEDGTGTDRLRWELMWSDGLWRSKATTPTHMQLFEGWLWLRRRSWGLHRQKKKYHELTAKLTQLGLQGEELLMYTTERSWQSGEKGNVSFGTSLPNEGAAASDATVQVEAGKQCHCPA